MKRFFAVSMFALLTVSGVAHSTTIVTFEFVGEIEHVTDPLVGSLPGSIFTGVFRYDSELPDDDPVDPKFGEYEPLENGHATVESEQPGVPNYLILTSDGRIAVENNGVRGQDAIHVHGGSPRELCRGIRAPIVVGFRLCGYDLILRDKDGLVFDSDSLPLSAPDLEQFEENFFMLEFVRVGEPVDREFVSGVITSLRLISVSVPEPGTLGLLGLGLLGLGLTRRKLN